MSRSVVALVALFAALPAVGCGTLSNQHVLGPMGDYRLEKRYKRLYGGVRSDGEKIGEMYCKWVCGDTDPADPIWGRDENHDPPPNNLLVVPYVTLFLLADIPLSFVADTVLLPWDVRAQWRRLTAGMTESPPASRRPQQVEPPPSEVLKLLEKDTFTPWQLSGRIDRTVCPPKTGPGGQ